MSTALIDELEPSEADDREIILVDAEGFPPPRHLAEADCFARHEGVPGHDQLALEGARIAIVGAGGLGSWTALSLARSGAKALTIIDPDRFERSNAARQLLYGNDIGRSKAFAVAQNVAAHMIGGGQITAMRLPFLDAAERFTIAADVVVCLVDNNRCRLEAVRFTKRAGIPAVFGMLSTDSMRFHGFLQQAAPDAPCLWCALPNLEPEASSPCAAATIVSCLLVAAHVSFFVHRALMGWPENVAMFNWREVDLTAHAPDRAGFVARRRHCSVCSN